MGFEQNTSYVSGQRLEGGHTIMDAINNLILVHGGTPTGNGGTIVDKIKQLEALVMGEQAKSGHAGTISDAINDYVNADPTDNSSEDPET